MVPLEHLYSQGVKNIEKMYVGSQKSAILSVYAGDSDACGTWPIPWLEFEQKESSKAKELKVLFKTKNLPNCSIIAKKSVDIAVQKRFATSLINMNKTTIRKNLITKAGLFGFEYANNSNYNKVAEFMKRYNEIKKDLE
jgi:ABC-type phosphate/phosphonate transport system substrate-binding protein